MRSAAGCISEEWNGAETGSGSARFTPFALAISMARSIAPLWPESTTCPPPLSFATSQTSFWAASRAISAASSHSAPISAHIAPRPTGTAACMASPRMRSSFAVSEIVSEPAAASAEYSPSECPATKSAALPRSRPFSASSVRITARDTAISAGWALAVRVS